MESYRNTEPNPAVKGEKKSWLSFKNSIKSGRKKGQKPHDQGTASAKSGVLHPGKRSTGLLQDWHQSFSSRAN